MKIEIKVNEEPTEKINEFNRQCGEILTIALGMETRLEFFITNYFVMPQSGKTLFLNDILTETLKLSFEEKINVFREICKREEFDKKEVDEIIKSIKYVQEIRNKVAHWQREITNDKIVQLRKRKTFTTNKDTLSIDKTELSKFEKANNLAAKGVIMLYSKYINDGTIDKRKEFVI